MLKLITNSSEFLTKLLHSSKMPAFTLYGKCGSTNTDRVRLTLAEAGFADYELVHLNLQEGEQKVSEYCLFEDDAAYRHVSKLCVANTAAPSLKNT
jgi:hypothetical protein